jgi:hypothetical protein
MRARARGSQGYVCIATAAGFATCNDMRLGDPQQQNPRLLIRRQPRVRPRNTASRCVQGGTGADGDPNGDPDGGGDDDDDGFRRGATARSAGVGASRRLPLLPLLPLPPPLLCCPGMRVRATLTATKRRGLPAGSAAKATCLESLLAQPPLASLPAWGTGHHPRTTHCTALRTAWSGDFRLVGVVALNQVPVAGVVGVAGVAGRGARAMVVARASLTRAQRHPGPCWTIAGPCRELSSTLFQPRRPSERAGWQPYGERWTVCFHRASLQHPPPEPWSQGRRTRLQRFSLDSRIPW